MIYYIYVCKCKIIIFMKIWLLSIMKFWGLLDCIYYVCYFVIIMYVMNCNNICNKFKY